eukprot:1359202-Rhodomonas_salina.1
MQQRVTSLRTQAGQKAGCTVRALTELPVPTDGSLAEHLGALDAELKHEETNLQTMVAAGATEDAQRSTIISIARIRENITLDEHVRAALRANPSDAELTAKSTDVANAMYNSQLQWARSTSLDRQVKAASDALALVRAQHEECMRQIGDAEPSLEMVEVRLRLSTAVEESERQLELGMRLASQQKETAQQTELQAEHEAVLMTALLTMVEYDLDEGEGEEDDIPDDEVRETAPVELGMTEPLTKMLRELWRSAEPSSSTKYGCGCGRCTFTSLLTNPSSQGQTCTSRARIAPTIPTSLEVLLLFLQHEPHSTTEMGSQYAT